MFTHLTHESGSMYAQIDEMTDERVKIERSDNRVRIAYGRSVVLVLDPGEAADLIATLTTVLDANPRNVTTDSHVTPDANPQVNPEKDGRK